MENLESQESVVFEQMVYLRYRGRSPVVLCPSVSHDILYRQR